MTKYLDERFTKKTLQLKRDRNADIRDSVELRVCFFWYKNTCKSHVDRESNEVLIYFMIS